MQMGNQDAEQLETHQKTQKTEQPRQELKVVKFLQRLSTAYYKEVTHQEVIHSRINGPPEIFTERNATNKMITI